MPATRSADGYDMETINHHPEADVLEMHLLNRLIAREHEAVEQHLLACPRCRITVKGLRQDIELMRAALS